MQQAIELLNQERAELKVEQARELEIYQHRIAELEQSYQEFKIEKKEEIANLNKSLLEAKTMIAQLKERQRQFKFIQEFLEEQSRA